LGQGGSVITKIIKDAPSADVDNIAKGMAITKTFTIIGAVPGATVTVSPQSVLPDGVIISYARVSASDTVEVKFFNASALDADPASMRYFITIVE
jgi:trimeric autotransporter adhesin